jgi:hypothetical protein
VSSLLRDHRFLYRWCPGIRNQIKKAFLRSISVLVSDWSVEGDRLFDVGRLNPSLRLLFGQAEFVCQLSCRRLSRKLLSQDGAKSCQLSNLPLKMDGGSDGVCCVGYSD